MTQSRVWRNGKVVARDLPADELDRHLGGDDVVWIDLDTEATADIQRVARLLDIDPIAVEDAVGARERVKLDWYDDYVFVNAYATTLCEQEIETNEVSAFVSATAIVTVHDPDWDGMSAIAARWEEHDTLAAAGAPGLLYGLLDTLVDGHLDAVDALDDLAEGFEDSLFGEHAMSRGELSRVFAVRKSLVRLRRVALPMREALNSLLRRDSELISDKLRHYFEDVYDHALRVVESSDSVRDLLVTLHDTNLSLQDQRLNMVMKKLTGWAAIIAVPTAITGFYGQNVRFPGDGTAWGFWASSVIIALSAVLLYAAFRRRDWL